MKAFYDLIPVILFFIAYKLFDIYVATGVIIAACALQVGITYAIKKKVEKAQGITLVVVLIFGGLTLALRNPQFIKWKPSIVNWILALVFLGSQWIGEKPLVQRMMARGFDMPRNLWLRLNTAWALFFIGCGLLNLFVAYRFSEDTWVNFKLFGLTGLSFLFIIGQMVVLKGYLKAEEAS